MKENVSSRYLLEEAKAAVNHAENTWKRISNAYFRLHRERIQNRSQITEAEEQARKTYEKALAELRAAREHLRFVQSTTRMSKQKKNRRADEEEREEGQP